MKTIKSNKAVSNILEVTGVLQGLSDVSAKCVETSANLLAGFVSMTEDEFLDYKHAMKVVNACFTYELKVKVSRVRKQRTKKTKATPKTPLKEKKIEKKRDDTNIAGRDFSVSFDVRRAEFREQCLAYITVYPSERVADFFNYWSEEAADGARMRFEVQRFWNLDKRIKRWMNNHLATLDTLAKEKLQSSANAKKKIKAQQAEGLEHAKIREENQLRIEKEIAESKAGAVDVQQWLKNHSKDSTGALTKLIRNVK